MTDTRRIAKNSFFLLILTLSNYFIGLLLFPYISRVLSISNFGIIGFAMSYAMFYQSIVEYGFMISVTARISKSRHDKAIVSRIITDTMLSKVMLLIVSLSIFFASSSFIPIVNDNLSIMTLFILCSVTTAMLPDFYFRGMEKMKSIAIRSFTSRLLSIAIVIMAVHSNEDMYFIPIALLIGNLLAVCWAWFSMYQEGFRFSKTRLDFVVENLKDGFMYFLSRIAATTNQALGAFALGTTSLVSPQQLGFYSAASRISLAGEMLLIPMLDSLFPHMINKKDYRLFWRIYKLGVVFWFFGCLVTFIFAETFCTIILGDEYRESANILRILLLGNFMAFSSSMFGYNALAPIGLVWHANIAILASVVINVILLSIMFFVGLATLRNICIVVASTNLIIFSYRALIFFINRKLARF
jgi:O-antigen/teichoic acid export membrane protein